jgi:hypothetical protein
MGKRTEFTNSRFILSEGFEDAACIRALIQTGRVPAFEVSPNGDIGGISGNSGFETAVGACEAITGFTGVTEVVILADNDDDPVSSFAQLCAQLERARRNGSLQRNWGAAVQPVTKAVGDPSLSIWMWPAPGQPGCLETILWQVLETKYPDESKRVHAACKCSGANAWPVSKLDKARVRCFMSLVCKQNPSLVLGNLWRDWPDLIPLDHPSFIPISQFLAKI